MSQTSVAERVSLNINEIGLAAEEILFNSDPGVPFTAAERNVLKAAGIVTADDIARQLGRVCAVREQMKLYGSRKEHLEAEKAVINAVREEQQLLSTLETKLREVQSQIDRIGQKTAAARAELHQRNQARDALRSYQLLPAHVREQDEIDRHSIDMRYQRITELEVELRVIEKLATIEPGSDECKLHIEVAAPHLMRERVIPTGVGQNVLARRFTDAVGWSGYVKSRQAPVPALQEELRQLQAKRKAELAELDENLNWYLDRLAS